MSLWSAVLLGVAALAVVPALYGLHRLCLWLEARGQLYYWHKQPGGSPARCMTGLQEVLEPQVKHVLHLREQRRQHRQDEGGPGGEDPPPPAPAAPSASVRG